MTKGLRALTTSKERKEIRAIGKQSVKLQYIGKMAWSEQYGIDSRMWNVISPALAGYPLNSGKPTLTVLGLKERGLI